MATIIPNYVVRVNFGPATAKPKPRKPPNKVIKGTPAGGVHVATRCECVPCGWRRLVLADEETPAVCPECDGATTEQAIVSPLGCPNCGGSAGVLSVTTRGKEQICAICARTGYSVAMQPSDI